MRVNIVVVSIPILNFFTYNERELFTLSSGVVLILVHVTLRPIYTVRFLLTIVACDFCSARCSRHGKIVYDSHDIKLPVATIDVGF